MHSDGLFVLNMFKAGLRVPPEDCALEELVKAVRTMNRQVYLSPGISDIVIKDFVIGWFASPRRPAYSSWRRRRQVLQLMAEAKTPTKSPSLFVSVKTVKPIVSN
jgi:DNA-binding NarL/FixJ family response regulator